jgi:hypothetical protein
VCVAGNLSLFSTSQVDFQDVNARTLAERKREEEKQKHLDKIHRERAELAQREIEGKFQNCGILQVLVAAGTSLPQLSSAQPAYPPCCRRLRKAGQLRSGLWLYRVPAPSVPPGG